MLIVIIILFLVFISSLLCRSSHTFKQSLRSPCASNHLTTLCNSTTTGRLALYVFVFEMLLLVRNFRTASKYEISLIKFQQFQKQSQEFCKKQNSLCYRTNHVSSQSGEWSSQDLDEWSSWWWQSWWQQRFCLLINLHFYWAVRTIGYCRYGEFRALLNLFSPFEVKMISFPMNYYACTSKTHTAFKGII